MSKLFICHIIYSNNFSHGQITLNIDFCCFVKYCSWFKKREKWQVCGKCVAGVWQLVVSVWQCARSVCQRGRQVCCFSVAVECQQAGMSDNWAYENHGRETS